ncbi:MAG: M15 family metallopeptidase [Candidatus Moranbacteria bacterium]|nr:M15 family metallopeptidase [Candidatus Moranbacteria bacterium]
MPIIVFSRGKGIIVDSALGKKEALRDNPQFPCPSVIRARQRLITLDYWSFDGAVHRGQMVLDRRIALDVEAIFEGLLQGRFPLAKVIPITFYGFDDILSMRDNNSSGFNYRKKSNRDELSLHALGQALDINPWQNPYIKGDYVAPEGARYDPRARGTLTKDSLPVQLFKARGFIWGGDWVECKDYQHFEKPFPV